MARRKDQRDRILVPLTWFEEETRYGAKLLGLTDWDITVEAKLKFKKSDAGGDLEGFADIHDGHLTVHITYRQDVLRGEARYNVYHELGHVMFRQWNLADQKVMDEMVPDALTERVNEVLTKGEEDAVERFAHAVVRLLPVERKEPDGAVA